MRTWKPISLLLIAIAVSASCKSAPSGQAAIARGEAQSESKLDAGSSEPAADAAPAMTFDTSEELVEQITSLVLSKKYEEAEPLAHQCLKNAPKDFVCLSLLDIALNGQEKFVEADTLRDKIRTTWEKHEKEQWLADGSPIAKATWARMILHTDKYLVIGVEYYQPEVSGPETPITTFYKVIAEPKTDAVASRIFKLEMSKLVSEYYVLRELLSNGGAQVIPYGKTKPPFRSVLVDARNFLDAAK